MLQRQGDCGLVLVPGRGEPGGLLQDGGQRGRGGGGGPHTQLAAAAGGVVAGRRGRGRGGGGGREGLGLQRGVGHPHTAALCKPGKWWL